MIRGVRLYIEGGGDARAGKDELRRGFSAFLQSIRSLARARQLGFKVVLAGSRDMAERAYRNALEHYPDEFVALLTDAEGPANSPGDDRRHLMVQLFEAWLLADPEALATFYRQGFERTALPGNPDVEAVPKADVLPALERATRKTQKGAYHKIKHAAVLLHRLDSGKVRARAANCERLFATLIRVVEQA